jgi:hypothetical protein
MQAEQPTFSPSRLAVTLALIALLSLVAAVVAFTLTQRNQRGGTNDLGKPAAYIEQTSAQAA